MKHLSVRNLLFYYTFVLIVVSFPFFFSKYPHILDFPGHLARVKVLVDYSDSSLYKNVYQINNIITPNIAFDFLVFLLHKFIPLMIAGKLFIIFSFASTVSGTVFLHHALFKKISYWPLCSSLFLYNLILHYGFVNYLFGIGMMLWGIAIWIKISHRNLFARMFWGLIIGWMIFFTHIISFVLYAVVIGIIELEKSLLNFYRFRRLPVRDVLITLIPLLLPVLYLFRSVESAAKSPSFYFIGITDKIKWAILNLSWDAGLVDFSLIIGLGLILCIAILWGRISFSRQMIFPSSILFLVFFISPSGFIGGSYLDTRLPIAILFVLLSSCKVSFKSKISGIMVAVLFLMLLVSRSYFISMNWKKYDNTVGEIVSAVSSIPQNSTLILASEMLSYPSPMPVGNAYWQLPLHHVVAYATMNKPIFVPDIWAEKNQHSIVINNKYKELYRFQGTLAILVKSTEDFQLLIKNIKELHGKIYDSISNMITPSLFLLLLNHKRFSSYHPPCTKIISRNDIFILYEIL